MTKLVWGEFGERKYSSGVDRGVLYVGSSVGVPWNGISAIDELNNEQLESYYIDGQCYLNIVRSDGYSAKLTAYTCPTEFASCEGRSSVRNGLIVTDQPRTNFNLSYRTQITDEQSTGYKIHLVYNATAKSNSAQYRSVGSSVDVTAFSWDISTIAPTSSTYKPTAHVIVDTTITYPWVISALEDILYGNVNNEPRFPSQEELIELFEESSIVQIVDHGDGSFSITGPSDLVHEVDSTTYTVTTPSIVYIDSERYTISSL
jgi:hypothetical protein